MATPRRSRLLRVTPFMLIMACAGSSVCGKVIYVDHDAVGAGNGSSWADAYCCLQNALADARSGDEIRVAEGTYKPDRQLGVGRGARIVASGDRTATFQLKNGVAIRGGYAGSGRPDPDARNIKLMDTFLSGDLNDDDRPGFRNNSENSYQVVTGSGTDRTAVLEGFIIIRGNADGLKPYHAGGGIYNQLGSPTLISCTFDGNWGERGGAMANEGQSSPALTDCTFTGNSSKSSGGAIYNIMSSPTLTNCTLTGNSAGEKGGAIYNDRGNLTLLDCVFIDNTSVSNGAALKLISSDATITGCRFLGNITLGGGSANAGAIGNDTSSPVIRDCTFVNNSSPRYSGGAIVNYGGSNPTMVGCIFHGNSAGSGGGAVFNWISSSPLVVNCIFTGNSANRGGGMTNNDNCHPKVINCTFVGNRARDTGGGMWSQTSSSPGLSNCILWENTDDNGMNMDQSAQIDSDSTSTASVNYCDILGLTRVMGGVGNIGADPRFVDADGADEMIGTEDDDLRLSPDSPCIDAGDNRAIPQSVVTDLDGNSRIMNGIVDMGAYETATARMPDEIEAGGGTGEPDDPYQIATAEDLMLRGDSPEDYDKHFILTADIDLDPNLPGNKVFDKAVIAPDTDPSDTLDEFQGTPFTGVFDGNNHKISNLTVVGEGYLGLFGQLGPGAEISNLRLVAVDVNGVRNYVGGLAGDNSGGSITMSYSAGTVGGSVFVGGLVGTNGFGSSITTSYSTGAVSGDREVGGIGGSNGGSIVNSYRTGAVSGRVFVGGLVGRNGGIITASYSTAEVTGNVRVGGLVGNNYGDGHITSSFWDIESSGLPTSAGGIGKTTAEMQMIGTFLGAGWDFANETENGNDDIWWILEGQDYPKLWRLNAAVGRVIYVDADATGANTGSSWADAYCCLQNALADAQPGDKICVAEGIYRPDEALTTGRVAQIEASGDRTATFQLKNGVTIEGGYAGFAQPDPNARDIEAYVTVLSGDLGGDDGPDYANNSENSYHVVVGSGTDVTAVLDGVTITGGNGNGSSPNHRGGGMNNDPGSPTVVNCIFSGNSATSGGGMSNSNGSNPIVANCTFRDNSAANQAGGMRNNHSSPTVTNCTFSRNLANAGGGMTNRTGSPIITNCMFIGNVAQNNGGGMRNWYDSYPTVTNCTFSGNVATRGGGIYNSNNSISAVTNCILWGDTPEEVYGEHVTTFSDVQNGRPAEGNIDIDPLFVDPSAGDYHLCSAGGRYWPEHDVWVLDKATSPCVDSGDPSSDPSGEPMPNGGRINMGAYGGTPQASLAPRQPSGQPDRASNPSPADGAVGVAIDAKLSWTAGSGAVSHDVHLGTAGSLSFLGNQTTTQFDPGTLISGTTYFWRVDEISSTGSTTGEVWSFTAAGPPKGRACFTGDTPIWIDGNLIPISSVGVGQIVRRGDGQSEVEELQAHDGAFTCYDIVFETGNCIAVAECHYFMTESGQWIAVRDLKTDTRLKTLKGDVGVTTVTKRPKPYLGKVYNLKIKESDRYSVGKDAIVVRDY